MSYEHSCPKCQKVYRDDDPDDYLCTSCRESRKQIAAEIDAKFAGRPSSRPASALQEYDNAPKDAFTGKYMIYHPET